MRKHPAEGGGAVMDRRAFMVSGVVGAALAVTGAGAPGPARASTAPPTAASDPGGFALAEAAVEGLRQLMQSGKMSARELAEQYLSRIDALDQRGPSVNAVLELNPDALEIAERLDAERKAKGPRGPLLESRCCSKKTSRPRARCRRRRARLPCWGPRRSGRVHRRAPAGGRRAHPRKDQPQRAPLHAAPPGAVTGADRRRAQW